MQKHSTNITQINTSNDYNVSFNTTPYANTVYIPVNSDVSGNLGYGMGRVLRTAFDYAYDAWQKWWHPGPSAARVAQQRQAAIYRAGLDVTIEQLDRALDNLRKNPRAVSSLEQFKRVVNDHQKYLHPAPTEKLRAYQTRLLHQLRSKVQQLKLSRLRETVLAYFPVLRAEGNFLATDSASPILTETLNTLTKRSIASQTSSAPVPAPQPIPNPVVFQNPFNLTTLSGSNGFAVDGVTAGDFLGWSVSGAGDVNGDGKADLVLGAIYGSAGAGTAYVIFGQGSGFPAKLNLTTLNGVNGFAVDGEIAGGHLGASVSNAGDVNGDGIADLVLGADITSPSRRPYAGAVYVIFGQGSGFPAQFNLTTLNGVNGFVVDGVAANDGLGFSVSSAGDVNGDGIADLVLGAHGASPSERTQAGMVYVIFGQGNGFPAQFNLTTLNGVNGFTVDGLMAGDQLGLSVSSSGDVNGDGKADLMLGAWYASPSGRTQAGTVYVIFGQGSGFPAQFNLTTLNGVNGFAVDGVAAGDWLGRSVSGAGDVNGDGKPDLVLGADTASPSGRTQAGTVYVLFGQGSGFPPRFNLTTLNGVNGFAVDGVAAGDYLGASVSGIGDVNGDGKADLVLGAYGASPGTAYVLFGKGSGFPSRLDLTTLNGVNGFVVEGVMAGDNFGYSVSGAGDVNGDGIADLVLGAVIASPSGRTEAGAAYVIFSPKPMISPQPAPSNPTISPEPTPSLNPSANLIPQNLTGCAQNQPLQWLYHDIMIASAQALRLSPLDISVACGNSSQPYLGAYFSVTNIQSATLKHCNATGGWDVGQLTFLGQDLATGQVVLVQDGSAIAPELTVTATDGVTTLPNQAIQVQFTSINSSPVLISFHLAIPVDGRVTLTSNDIVLSSSTGKVADLVLSVTGVQNGYFAQIDAPNVPITEFTGYQVQTGQIQVAHTGDNEPIRFNIKVSDGLTSSVVQPETITTFGTPNDPVTQIGTIVGGAVAGGILLAGGLAAFGFYLNAMQRRVKRLKKVSDLLAQCTSEKKQID